MESKVLYEDKDVIAVLPTQCIAKGELLLMPKDKFVIIEQVPKDLLSKMFMLANNLSSALFSKLNCHGTNILIQNGIPAGQSIDQFCIRIIPRYENDGIDFEWQRKQADAAELDKIHGRFLEIERKEKEDAHKQQQKLKAESEKQPERISTDEKENYLIKHLDRVA